MRKGSEKSGGFPKGLANLQTAGPTEEGKEDNRFLSNFVLESPLVSLQKGNFPKIPLLTGVTKQETSTGIQGNFLEQIVQKLLSPSFLEGGLFKDLLYANTGLFVNKTANPNLVSLFSNGDYLKFFTSVISGALSDVQKVIQHTTDAFFNLPAFLMSHNWSKGSNVYLYSFEHDLQKHTGDKFLNGISLVSNGTNNTETKEPSHGDDLIYLFDVRTIHGEPYPEKIPFNENDKKVREHFQSMVSEFAKTGQPRVAGGETWTPFNPKDGNYMIIKGVPKLAKDFHKCSMGLWTGEQSLLSSSECALGEASKIVTNTIGSAGSGLLNAVGGIEGKFGGVLGGVTNTTTGGVSGITSGAAQGVGGLTGGLGGLLGGGGGKKKEASTSTQKTTTTTEKTKRKGGGGLLGGLGF